MVEIEQDPSRSMLDGAPADDVVEISVFGPGRGESIAVHLGDGRWIVVDSCIQKGTRDIPILNYLSRIGVEVEHQVRLVVATHAHDDHFAGISRILEACPTADFVCPSALSSPEFFALTDIEEQEHAGLPVRAYREYRRIFEIVESRGARGLEPVQFASARMHLFTEIGTDFYREVIALSPSSKAYRRAMRALRKVVPHPGEAAIIPPIDPNELAIALWIMAGEKRLLLGADLLKGPNGSGWHAVLLGPRPDRKASVFKVPHHGSGNAYRQGVWSELLMTEPLALLTPYRGAPVPKAADRRRILKHTSSAFITAPPERPLVPGDVRREMAALGSLAKNVRMADTLCGHIRARSVLGEDKWHVELAGPAEPLSP